MALYYLEEVSRRKENPRRFVTERRGLRTWVSKDRAKKYTPRRLMVTLAELRHSPFVFQPTPVEVEHEPT